MVDSPENIDSLYESVNRSMIMFVKSQNKNELIGAEIGVFEGEHAQNILSILPIKMLYLVDFYKLPAPKKTSSIALTPFSKKIKWVYKSSLLAVNYLPNDLDFVYIDANHTYPYIKQDIDLWWPKIKIGGVLGGHDYITTATDSGVKQAVDEFVQKNKLKLYTGGWDWWIVK